MHWNNLLIALLPVPVFYLVYYRYFRFRPNYLKHLEASLAGAIGALLLILLVPFLFGTASFTNAFAIGFLGAAIPEKTAALAGLLLIQRFYPGFSVTGMTLTAMFFGVGFSSVENIFYASSYGTQVIIVRLLFSVPLHMTTCGMMGYYLGLRKMSDTRFFRVWFLVLSMSVPVLMHGIFDSILIMGGYAVFLIAFVLILMVTILELMLARSRNIVNDYVLHAMNIRLEDWLLINRQPRYDRWILKSMGMPGNRPSHLFLWRPGLIRFLLVILFMAVAIAGLSFQNEIMETLSLSLIRQDRMIILGVFPLSLSIILILVGAINPDFFRNSQITIPIIYDVVVRNDDSMEETLVTYDISPVNTFLRSSETYGIGTELELEFEYQRLSSGRLRGVVMWENYTDANEPMGALVKLMNYPRGFIMFILRYNIFRLKKGLIFTMKLPGFESVRKLFMRPISTMQEVRVYSADTVLFNEGERGSEFYLIKKGKVIFYKKTESGDIITMNLAEEGQIFGEMALIGANERATTARCLTDCVLAVADRDNLNALISSNTDFAWNLIQTLVRRSHMSEKILVSNIHELEEQKRRSENLFHTALLLTLIGVGYYPDGNNEDMDIDLSKMSEVVSRMDDYAVEEISNIILLKQDHSRVNDPQLKKEVLERISRLYERYSQED